MPQEELDDLRDRLNCTRWPNETTPTGFVHQRSGRPDAVPIALLHGWPDSFYRYVHLIDRLTAGDGPAFDVIVPSLPGFDLSDHRPAGTGEQDSVFPAEVIAELLEGLAYDRYLVHGGDWAPIGLQIARTHSDRVKGPQNGCKPSPFGERPRGPGKFPESIYSCRYDSKFSRQASGPGTIRRPSRLFETDGTISPFGRRSGSITKLIRRRPSI